MEMSLKVILKMDYGMELEVFIGVLKMIHYSGIIILDNLLMVIEVGLEYIFGQMVISTKATL